jgi:ATPase subunit of ABC transporter with duplicated ATPase domains
LYSFSDLSFRYRDYIFRDYTRTIPEAKIGIVGPNGVGKTTLLKLLDRQLTPERGECRVEGATYLVDFNLAKYRNFYVDDLLNLAGRLESFDLDGVAGLLAALHLDDYRQIPLGELSKGVQKKTSLLLGLLSTADILLVDEPFESLDTESNQNLIGLFRARRQGLAIVSHDHDHLRDCVDALYRVGDGGMERWPC